jgi:hypothetical protein
MSQPEVSPPPPGGNVLGCVLLAIGALIVLPSGLCTALGGVALIAALFEDPSQIAANFTDVFPVIVVTLVSLAIGIGLIWAGWRSRRQ